MNWVAIAFLIILFLMVAEGLFLLLLPNLAKRICEGFSINLFRLVGLIELAIALILFGFYLISQT